MSLLYGNITEIILITNTKLNLELRELKIVVDFSVEMIRFQISYFISAFQACVLITPSYLKIS